MVNQVGGNDSLLFDGSSLVIAADGSVIAQGKSFEEDLIFCDIGARADMHWQTDNIDEATTRLSWGRASTCESAGFSKVLFQNP